MYVGARHFIKSSSTPPAVVTMQSTFKREMLTKLHLMLTSQSVNKKTTKHLQSCFPLCKSNTKNTFLSWSIHRANPQRPCDFNWQPSAPVSQTVWSSYLSHLIATTMYWRPCPPQSTHLPLLQRVDSTDDLVPQKWLGSLQLISLQLMKGSARIQAPPTLRMQKHTELCAQTTWD